MGEGPVGRGCYWAAEFTDLESSRIWEMEMLSSIFDCKVVIGLRAVSATFKGSS